MCLLMIYNQTLEHIEQHVYQKMHNMHIHHVTSSRFIWVLSNCKCSVQPCSNVLVILTVAQLTIICINTLQRVQALIVAAEGSS